MICPKCMNELFLFAWKMNTILLSFTFHKNKANNFLLNIKIRIKLSAEGVENHYKEAQSKYISLFYLGASPKLVILNQVSRGALEGAFQGCHGMVCNIKCANMIH